ncbi:MAG: 3-isopropylmalate dehydrogenase [Janthinobacterium lividum]
MTKTLLLLPGDGIGPEVTAQAARIVDRLNASHGLDVTTATGHLGGVGIDADGVPLTAATLAQAKASDAVLMGAVGGPQWAKQPYDKRPEAGLLALRSGMNVFANLRPAKCFAALVDASSLKREIVDGLDILFVRELTGGVYFGEPRGIEDLGNGERRGVNTHVYTSSEIRRVARVAFDLARHRSGRVASAEKGNAMEAGLLWREEVQALRDAEYPHIELTHILADNCAMQLVKAPRQFDIILTDNLFGDILSDAAAMLTGSLGMLPSAALGEAGTPGLYEPIHGSAPGIAGKGVANPGASILSLAMALRYSLGRPDLADMVEGAVSAALDAGARTRDIGGTLGTEAMADAVLAHL